MLHCETVDFSRTQLRISAPDTGTGEITSGPGELQSLAQALLRRHPLEDLDVHATVLIGLPHDSPDSYFRLRKNMARCLRRCGLTVLSTTRSEKKLDALRSIGVHHPLADGGDVARQVRGILGDGVHSALELLGTSTPPDTLRATRVHGVVCFTGMLSNKWTIEQFYPIEYLPRGVRLTAYGGAGDRTTCLQTCSPSFSVQ